MRVYQNSRGLRQKINLFVKPRARILAPLFTLIVLSIFFGIVTNSFLTLRNLENVLEQGSLLMIMTTGLTLILLVGEIDLAFANVATLIGLMMAAMANRQISVIWIIPACLCIGFIIGLVDGYISAYIRVPSFMATLAMSVIAYGIAHYTSQASPIFTVPKLFAIIGNKNLGFVPWVLICAIAVGGIMHFVLRYTRFGRYIYMTGGNREAAKVSGVNINFIITAVFVISGVITGFSGMIGIGRLGVAYDNSLNTKLIDGIAAVVLGGTSLTGGEGSILNTVIGVLIWTILGVGLNLMDISIFLKDLVRGTILLLALIFNIVLQRSTAVEA